MTDGVGDDELQVRVVVVEDGVAHLEWDGAATDAMLTKGIGLAADDAIMGHGVRRLEVQVRTGDVAVRRALHRAGFRLEGIRRQAFDDGTEQRADVALYARLAGDLAYGAEGFSATMNSVLPRTRTMAHVLFRDETGRLLFFQPTYKDDWELPGGVIEPGEPPAEGARREVLEETGLDVPLSRLLCVDWMPPFLGWDDALELTFDGGVLSAAQVAAIVPQDHEVKTVHWTDAAEASTHLIPDAAARLASVLPLLDDPSAGPLYLERGRPRA